MDSNEPEVKIIRHDPPEDSTSEIVPEPAQAEYRNEDEEELKVSIKGVGGFVILNFHKPVQFIKFAKRDAREFARRLVKETL